MAPQPPLYPAANAGTAEIVAQWADTTLFWTAVPYTMQPAGAAHIFQGAPADFLKAFREDRAAMTAGTRRATVADAGAQLATYMGWLERQLGDGRAWLMGAAPSIADFAAAQSVWYIRRAPPIAVRLAPYERVLAWYERVAALGHGTATPLSSAEALDLARS